MKNNKYTFVCLITLVASIASGQNITDIVRWSDLQPQGTATSSGVSNSIGAIGGDIMSAYINPAGLGEFKKSVFNFTAGLELHDNTAYLVGDRNNANTVRSNSFGIQNIGLVFGNYRPKRNFTSSNFAIGFTRQQNLKNKFSYRGNTLGTITEYFAERANSLSPNQLDDFVAYPAYNTGAIFDFDGDKFYETDFAQDDLIVSKNQNVKRTGSVNELTLAWAGEYKDKFNIGIGIGIPFANYTEQKVYAENDTDGSIATFNSLKYIEDLTITGRGFNTKLGVLFKPVNWLRVGGAFHSPTWFTFTDTYSTSLEYSYDDVTNVYPGSNDEQPVLEFQYKINNPWKAIGSIGSAFQIGKVNGFVNADVEYIDYVSAEYDGTAYSDDPSEIDYTNYVNESISNTLAAATNFRLGAELGYDMFKIRGGMYQFQSPFKSETETGRQYSVGLGFRGEKFYLDFALLFGSQTTGYNAYTVTNADRDPLVNIEDQRTNAMVTLGFRL